MGTFGPVDLKGMIFPYFILLFTKNFFNQHLTNVISTIPQIPIQYVEEITL